MIGLKEASLGIEPNEGLFPHVESVTQAQVSTHLGIGFIENPCAVPIYLQVGTCSADPAVDREISQRWLKAPFQSAEGELIERVSGTPQGGVVSPLLANLFLHYVFDQWMLRNFPHNPFARYADDAVVHCRSEAQARYLKQRLERRFRQCKLELHPGKTQIVCCRVDKQQHTQVAKQFDFLGYCFRPRLVRNRQGKLFVSFTAAISPRSVKRIRQEIRRWRRHVRTRMSLEDIAQLVNPVIRGWIRYFSAYQRSALVPVLRSINLALIKWVKWKYNKKGQYTKRARRWLGQVAKYQPRLFAHWQLGAPFPAE